MSNPRPVARTPDGFSLVELLVVIVIITVLAGLLLPSLSSAMKTSQRAACANHLRQLGLASALYVSDHEGQFPLQGSPNRWPNQMRGSYLEVRLLRCPSDPSAESGTVSLAKTRIDTAPRSYLINGFADAIQSTLTESEVLLYQARKLEVSFNEAALVHPSTTVVFGEKNTESTAFELNLLKSQGGYVQDLAQTRHNAVSARTTIGGANYTMADTSVQFMTSGKSISPINLWAVTDEWRGTKTSSQYR